MPRRLYVADHPAAVWSQVTEPWLRSHGTNWRERRTVLAPNAAWIAALKAAAVEAKLPVIGVQWLTPGRWRAQALRSLPGKLPHIALREDLHLLIELAAARLPGNPLANAYGQDPAPFQEISDALEGAGWGPEALPDTAAQELAALAVKLRAQAGWVTSAEADRRLCDAANAGKLLNLGHRLLAIGFGATDWPLRALLEAAVNAFANVELVLDVVDAEQTPSAAWVGAWEQTFGGVAEWLESPETPAPFAPLASAMLTTQPSSTAKIETPPQLWLADDLQAEADVVVAQALALLQNANDVQPARVGLVVGPINSPLAREVAARLVALGLPHHDSPGHLPGRSGPQALFEAWLDWQENGRLAGLVSWLRLRQIHGQVEEKSAAKIEASLQDALRMTLVDDPLVLAAWLAEAAGEHAAAREFLAAWSRLPESAPWNEFITSIASVAQKLGWPAPPEILAERAEALNEALAEFVPRAAVLRWVRAVTRIPGRTRDALGREPFAPLQIIEAANAVAQRWTHLILGGLQHGEWPANNGDSPLLDEAHIAALNRQSLRQGPQGEGHWTVAPGRGLILSQADRRKLERTVFARLAALPSVGLALTSRRNDPADSRPALPSEYFWAAARATIGWLPTEADWGKLAETTRSMREDFLQIAEGISPKPAPGKNLPAVTQTAHAFAARRDPTTPFDEYSFSLKQSPPRPLRLSCKAWEGAVDNPAAAWFEKALRIEPRWDPDTDDCTRPSIGTWAHNWVRPGPSTTSAAGSPEALLLPNGELWRKLAADRASELRKSVVAAFALAQRPLPEAWLDAWADTARAADQWISALADLPEWTHAVTEVSLPGGLLGDLPAGVGKIPLAGRMDLVLFPRAVTLAPGEIEGIAAWVVDFKSGNADALKLRQLAKGKGLQVALYALALQALGAQTVSLTVLSRDAVGAAQLTDEDLRAPELDALWRLLAAFAVEGCWGERPDRADDYVASPRRPAATLPVADEILRLKWKHTHPYSQ